MQLIYLFRLFISWAEPASKENLVRPGSADVISVGAANKLPVLLFFGIRRESSGDAGGAGEMATLGE